MGSQERRRGLAAAVVVVILLGMVLREAGAFDFSLHSTTTTHNFTAGTSHPPAASDRGLEVELVDGSVTQHHVVHRASTEPPLSVKAEVTRFDLSGFYWLPLLKSAECSYEVQITSADGSVKGSIAGRIERKAFGLHSVRGFREGLHEELSKKVMSCLSQ
jgi:hypothetical protein